MFNLQLAMNGILCGVVAMVLADGPKLRNGLLQARGHGAWRAACGAARRAGGAAQPFAAQTRRKGATQPRGQGFTALVWWVILVSAVGGLLVAYVVRPLLARPLPRRAPWRRGYMSDRCPLSARQVRHLDSIHKNFAATCSIVLSTAISVPLFGFTARRSLLSVPPPRGVPPPCRAQRCAVRPAGSPPLSAASRLRRESVASGVSVRPPQVDLEFALGSVVVAGAIMMYTDPDLARTPADPAPACPLACLPARPPAARTGRWAVC